VAKAAVLMDVHMVSPIPSGGSDAENKRQEVYMKRSCGRIRKKIGRGWTQIIQGELQNLEMAVLKLGKGETFVLNTEDREYAAILISGACQVELLDGQAGSLGPRKNPFDDRPSGVLATRDETVRFEAVADCLLGIGSAPAEERVENIIVRPADVDVMTRGSGNWTREVRKVCWSDNTRGNLLLAGETRTPSGNWSTVPPHRHQYDVPGEEAPYEEAYFFQFSHPQGYGLIWQFDDEGDLDQAFSLKAGDAVYHNEGYHPTVCSPGTTLYHLTFMAGLRRESRARVHQDYQYILDEANLENQFTPGSTVASR
jgi:5-deoxy-glucuronate isomerase